MFDLRTDAPRATTRLCQFGQESRMIMGMTHDNRNTRSRLEQLCEAKGMRMTEQRRVIARVLSEAIDHPDVEEVYRRAASVDEGISLSTVYRTVRLFEEAGILERHDFGEGRARYEKVASEHHDHLIDLETGDVIEFRNEEIERLQERVARELGYSLVGHKLELYATPLKKNRQ